MFQRKWVKNYSRMIFNEILATGLAVDASQEMMTLGLCNIVGSCFKSMPTCGAFTRSAVSHTSGVKVDFIPNVERCNEQTKWTNAIFFQTPMAGLYSSIMTVLSLSLLTPYFKFIPKATLASVLVIAVMFMVRIYLFMLFFFLLQRKTWYDFTRVLYFSVVFPFLDCLKCVLSNYR